MKLPSQRNWLWLLMFSWAVAGGCASLPERGALPGGFDLRGKLGIAEGDESFSARFLWRQGSSAFDIELWGPLGQGRVNLSGNERRIELRRGDEVLSRGPPETVMTRHLGWSLPLRVLPQWVRGRPAPGLPVSGRSYDDQGRLVSFRQLDWRVELERLREVDSGAADAGRTVLPHRITARRGAYRVRLAVSEWQI
ncbi:MAG: lipoprotein insertase outer membrane protein LolB [Pseudomonadota bacterium]